jgi:hypothetical protein
MVKNGYTSKNWETKEFPGYAPNERSWGKRLAVPVTFLLGK